MSVITLQDVWTRAKQRCDIEKAGSSGFISDKEGLKLLQLATSQLQNLVMTSYDFWLTRYVVFTTVVNQLSYPTASVGMADFYKLIGIGLTTNAQSPQDSWTPLEHFDLVNISGPASTGFFQFSNPTSSTMRYGLMTNDKGAPTIELRPVKSATQIGVYYIPRPPQFDALNDELPLWIMPGWEEYLVAFTAWMISIKERSGTAQHKELWIMIADQIRQFAPNRDSFQPLRVTQGWAFNRNTWGA